MCLVIVRNKTWSCNLLFMYVGVTISNNQLLIPASYKKIISLGIIDHKSFYNNN